MDMEFKTANNRKYARISRCEAHVEVLKKNVKTV